MYEILNLWAITSLQSLVTIQQLRRMLVVVMRKWLILDDEVTFIANDLIIEVVNTTVECLEGTC